MGDLPFDPDPLEKLRTLTGSGAGDLTDDTAASGRQVIADVLSVAGARCLVARFLPVRGALPRPGFEAGEPGWLSIIAEVSAGTQRAWWINERGVIAQSTDMKTLPVDYARGQLGL